MIVLSMLLVVVGAVTLAIGAFFRDDLVFVWVSIASCLLAALFLAIGIARSRPSRRPPLVFGPASGETPWSGSGGVPPGDPDVAARADGPAPAPAPGAPAADESWADDERWAPLRHEGDLLETLADVEGVGPAKREAIAQRFGSLEALRRADVDDIAVVEGIGATLARRISEHVRT